MVCHCVIDISTWWGVCQTRSTSSKERGLGRSSGTARRETCSLKRGVRGQRGQGRVREKIKAQSVVGAESDDSEVYEMELTDEMVRFFAHSEQNRNQRGMGHLIGCIFVIWAWSWQPSGRVAVLVLVGMSPHVYVVNCPGMMSPKRNPQSWNLNWNNIPSKQKSSLIHQHMKIIYICHFVIMYMFICMTQVWLLIFRCI